MIGIVTNNKDDQKLGRVKVKFPALDEELESDGCASPPRAPARSAAC